MNGYTMKTIRAAATAALCLSISILAGCGGGSGATTVQPTGPGLSISKPVADSTIPDVDFINASKFSVVIDHSAALKTGSLYVTMKSNNSAAQDITSYFTETNSTTYTSSNITQFCSQLIGDIAANTENRTITITATARSKSGVEGSASVVFYVYPVDNNCQGCPPPLRVSGK